MTKTAIKKLKVELAERPLWAEEIRETFLRDESAVFVVHGNVYDVVVRNDGLIHTDEYLIEELLEKKNIVVQYNLSTGIRICRNNGNALGHALTMDFGEAEGPRTSLKLLELLLRSHENVAVVIDYAEGLAPAGDMATLSDDDRFALVTLHRWCFDHKIQENDNIVVLITENLNDLAPKVVSNPKIATVNIPLPTELERRAAIEVMWPSSFDMLDQLSSWSAGLRNIQIDAMLSGCANFGKLNLDKSMELLTKRKREILEKECFGLIEFVEPAHDFSAVGGMEEVKKDLMQIAKNIREGNKARVPMGILFVGPMGTGKTFVCEAFAKSSGLTAIKMKNFRSKWVGATEGNLEKILSVVKAIGNILVIIDEGDRSFGSSGDREGDGGTSSRVIARLKEFMSDTTNRGRVLFVLMTNRPDKLDIDIKRAGRLDKKIPFFYPQEADEIEAVILSQLKRHNVSNSVEFTRDRSQISLPLIGYSNADIEAIVLLAHDRASASSLDVCAETFAKAIDDYLPSRDVEMLEYMELLAVFEASSRSMLPRRYASIDVGKLQVQLREMKRQIR